MQAVWDDKNSILGHGALTPGHIPDQRDIETVVAWAPAGMRLIGDWGDVNRTAFARLATAGAYCFSRLHQQTTLWTTAAGRGHPVDLAPWLTTVAGPLLERAIFVGAKERVAARLMASRVPEALGNARRRNARKTAQKTG
jgi:hypothetical protein